MYNRIMPPSGESSNIKWINIAFRGMWVITLLLFVAIPMKMEWLQRICYWTYTFANLICLVLAFFEKNKAERIYKKKDTNLLILVLMIGATIVSLRFTGTFVLNADNILGYFSCIGMLFLIYYSDFIKNDAANIKFMGYINILIAILFLYFSRSGFAYGSGGKWNDSLTLGFANPNILAMFLFMNTIFLLIIKELFNKHIFKIVIIALIASNIYMMYLTKARSSLAAILIVLFIYIVKNKNFKHHPILSTLCVISPFIFIFLYTYLYEHNYFLDLEILGKTIYSGREDYYLEILHEIKLYDFGMIFGHFTEFQNTHNSALSLIRFFGLFGMTVYYIYIIINMHNMTKNGFQNKIAYICFIAILAVYIQSCAESAIILGGGAWIIFMATLYALAGHKAWKSEENDETIGTI